MLSWDDLRFVLALSRHGNATAAGKALGVNATTVTRRVQAAEEYLGTRLFDRGPTGAVPTRAGEVAVQTALRLEDDVLALDAEVRGLDAELQGRLRVTSTEMFFALWRHDLVEFQRRHPNIDLTLATNLLPVDLIRREADVALRLSAAPPEYLVGRRLSEVFFAVYGAQTLVDTLTAGETKPVPYRAYPWIVWDEPMAGPTDGFISQYAPGARISLRINTMDLLMRAIQDGIGISVVPCFCGDTTPGLVRLGEYMEGGVYIWTLTHEALRKQARVRAFVSLIAQAVERDRPLLIGERPRRPAVAIPRNDLAQAIEEPTAPGHTSAPEDTEP